MNNKVEIRDPSLTTQLREQAELNKLNGDKTSLNGRPWHRYGDHDYGHYEMTFNILPEGVDIFYFMKTRSSAVVLDIMSPSKAIASLFAQLPRSSNNFGLAVSLEDLRSGIEKKRDRRLSIEQISGDIMRSSTWREIERQLDGRKADLIMERGLAGLEKGLPVNLRLYAMLLDKTWCFLSREGGMLLAEVPARGVAEIYIKQWIDFLNKQRMHASYGRSTSGVRMVIKFIKTPDSPEKLPFLK